MKAPWHRPQSLKAKLFWVIIVVILIPQVGVGALGLISFATWSRSASSSVSAVAESGPGPMPGPASTPQPLPSGTSWPLARLEDDPNIPVFTDQIYLDYVRNRLPRSVYEQIDRGMREFSGGGDYQGGGGGPIILSEAESGQDPGGPVQLPPEALADLRRQGYAMGTTEVTAGMVEPGMEKADYVAFRVARDEAYVAFGFVGQASGVESATGRWWWSVMTIVVWLAVNVGIALAGAALLNRRIAGPVARVAEASALLAAGGEPSPLPIDHREPAEVGLLASSFNDMAAKLKRAQEAERGFLLSVSHELKTPLTAIRGYGETLAEGRASAEEAGPVITKEAGRLQRLVQDVLDLGRARTSSFSVRREAVDLAEVAREAGRRYEASAAEFGLELHVAADAPAPVIADGDRVLQAVSNLVENALRCTPAEGSVTIVVSPGEVQVTDTGLGLATGDLPHAFDRFFLYERYGKDRPVGTGLGLAIVKELTEAMDGSVSVESKLGVGTTFAVRLPSAEPPS